jgi:hypothetical protein
MGPAGLSAALLLAAPPAQAQELTTKQRGAV